MRPFSRNFGVEAVCKSDIGVKAMIRAAAQRRKTVSSPESLHFPQLNKVMPPPRLHRALGSGPGSENPPGDRAPGGRKQHHPHRNDGRGQ